MCTGIFFQTEVVWTDVYIYFVIEGHISVVKALNIQVRGPRLKNCGLLSGQQLSDGRDDNGRVKLN